MKNGIHTLRSVVLVALAACALSAGIARADVIVTVDPVAITNGYMNVFDLSNNYQWGSGWAPVDLTATWSGNDVTLGPNSIGDPNPYWYTPSGGPGAVGNKIMEANLYAEQTGPLAGQTVTFKGCVLANSLTPAHVATAFIRDFAPDFSSFNTTIIPLPTSGHFTLSLATVNDPARHVQYGFQVRGACVWVTDRGPFGSATIGTESATPAQPKSWGRLKSLYR